jgi:membrane protein implicated in regulation of membrane protease activity
MTAGDLKNLFVWILTIATGLLGACLVFISFVSIRIGLENTHQSGFWAPILAGILFLLLAAALLIYIVRRILRRMKEDTRINL